MASGGSGISFFFWGGEGKETTVIRWEFPMVKKEQLTQDV